MLSAGNSIRIPLSPRQSFAWDATAILLLALLAIWLFRGHFFGDSLWIGNPDRLNSVVLNSVIQYY